ncbi:hypothetical protein B0T17DRAFT_596480 [Bombardia bombarda]|uniref:Uncharacterized protein n=1 Tax=Bombardia bombarda TaxID=252184 RepID=A0AA39XN66_9PEZI|nr:hypothetical protein B0T17DRAFT_596480 [Bombardia bombarda]
MPVCPPCACLRVSRQGKEAATQAIKDPNEGGKGEARPVPAQFSAIGRDKQEEEGRYPANAVSKAGTIRPSNGRKKTGPDGPWLRVTRNGKLALRDGRPKTRPVKNQQQPLWQVSKVICPAEWIGHWPSWREHSTCRCHLTSRSILILVETGPTTAPLASRPGGTRGIRQAGHLKSKSSHRSGTARREKSARSADSHCYPFELSRLGGLCVCEVISDPPHHILCAYPSTQARSIPKQQQQQRNTPYCRYAVMYAAESGTRRCSSYQRYCTNSCAANPKRGRSRKIGHGNYGLLPTASLVWSASHRLGEGDGVMEAAG